MNEQEKKDFRREIQPIAAEIRIQFLEERVAELESTQREIFNVLKQMTRAVAELAGNPDVAERVRNL